LRESHDDNRYPNADTLAPICEAGPPRSSISGRSALIVMATGLAMGALGAAIYLLT
jgi:hypothetical protein